MYKLLKQKISETKSRSVWSKGVMKYAYELLECCEENNLEVTKENMLNGADSWSQFSYGGSSLIYDYDIAKRLCSPSELKRNKEGENNPNKQETWLDCQARALYQACSLILRKQKSIIK